MGVSAIEGGNECTRRIDRNHRHARTHGCTKWTHLEDSCLRLVLLGIQARPPPTRAHNTVQVDVVRNTRLGFVGIVQLDDITNPRSDHRTRHPVVERPERVFHTRAHRHRPLCGVQIHHQPGRISPLDGRRHIRRHGKRRSDARHCLDGGQANCLRLGKLRVMIQSVVKLLLEALCPCDFRLLLGRNVHAEGGRDLGGVELPHPTVVGG